jgi:hypothetical protein
VDLAFAWVAGIARRGTGGLIHPRRLELRRATGSREMYAAHFGCPARFDARENTMVFAKVDLDRPFLTHNANLFATIAPQLEAELSQARAAQAIGEQVKAILKPLLAGRRPDASRRAMAAGGWHRLPALAPSPAPQAFEAATAPALVSI